jgi:transposase
VKYWVFIINMKIDGRKLSPSQMEEIRFNVVKRIQSGESPSSVAKDRGLYTCRVFEWLALYRAGGWDVLKVNKGKGWGRKRKLTGRQLKWLYDAIHCCPV